MSKSETLIADEGIYLDGHSANFLEDHYFDPATVEGSAIADIVLTHLKAIDDAEELLVRLKVEKRETKAILEYAISRVEELGPRFDTAEAERLA